MCEFGVGSPVESTDDSRCAVHGAGLSKEDLDKPQVIENVYDDALTTNRLFDTDWDRPSLVGG